MERNTATIFVPLLLLLFATAGLYPPIKAAADKPPLSKPGPSPWQVSIEGCYKSDDANSPRVSDDEHKDNEHKEKSDQEEESFADSSDEEVEVHNDNNPYKEGVVMAKSLSPILDVQHINEANPPLASEDNNAFLKMLPVIILTMIVTTGACVFTIGNDSPFRKRKRK